MMWSLDISAHSILREWPLNLIFQRWEWSVPGAGGGPRGRPRLRVRPQVRGRHRDGQWLADHRHGQAWGEGHSSHYLQWWLLLHRLHFTSSKLGQILSSSGSWNPMDQATTSSHMCKVRTTTGTSLGPSEVFHRNIFLSYLLTFYIHGEYEV